MRFKIRVIVDYYPKNLFLGNALIMASKGKSGKGLLKPTVRK